MLRRSARLSKESATLVEKAKDHDVNMDDLDLMSVQSDDGEESDYCRRPAKRQKKISSSKTSKRQRKSGPSLLETIPIDVLFEILVYLQPYDMSMLAKTNRAFRNHLMSSGGQFLWRRSRDLVGAPAPPTSCSESKWANLLFGGSRCQNCGTTGVLGVDFGLCRRICTRCRKMNLVVHSKFSRMFPNYDTEILDLIPYTNIGGWTKGRRRNSKFYWTGDIHAMHEKLSLLHKDVTLQKPDAEARLDSFKKETAELVVKTQEAISLSTAWLGRHLSSKAQDRRDLVDHRRAEIQDAFVQMGYKTEDVKDALAYISVSANEKAMSPRAWTMAKRRCERLVIATRDARLLPVRTAALKPTYDNWVKTLEPAQWSHLPPLSSIVQDKAIVEIFHTGSGDIENPTVEEYSCLANKLSEIAAQWKTKMIAHFDEMFHQLQPSVQSQMRKDLTIIRCTYCPNTFVGVDEWVGHPWIYDSQTNSCCVVDGRRQHPIQYMYINQNKYLEALVELLGKDMQTITVEALDRLDPRFFCTCDNGTKKSAYSWRQFISHTYKYGTHAAFLVSDLPNLEAIKQQEKANPVDGWLCLHCPEFYQCSKPLSTVKEHIHQKHDIPVATERQDYMWDFTKPRARFTDAVKIEAQPVQPIQGKLQCSYCPNVIYNSEDCMETHARFMHGSDLVFGRNIILGKDFVMLASQE